MEQPARLVVAAHIAQRATRILARGSVTNMVRLTIAAMVLFTACATIRGLLARDTEELLTAAGFKKKLADPAHTKLLDATPPYRLVSRTKDGAGQYIYADPDNCRCVYLGGSKEYAEDRRLVTERQAGEDGGDRNSWGPQVPWGLGGALLPYPIPNLLRPRVRSISSRRSSLGRSARDNSPEPSIITARGARPSGRRGEALKPTDRP